MKTGNILLIWVLTDYPESERISNYDTSSQPEFKPKRMLVLHKMNILLVLNTNISSGQETQTEKKKV